MNKNIKKMIALTLALNAISTISPATLNTYIVGTQQVYASSYSPDDGELKSLKIKSLGGESLDLLDDYYGDKVKLSEDKEYYTRLTDDSDGIKISAESEGDDYIVKIFTSDNSDATAYDPGDKILLEKGNTTLYVRTYKSKSKFDKKNVTACEEVYKINIKKTTASSYEDDSQDAVYLSKLETSKGTLDFIKGKTSYDIKVNEDADSMWIKAVSESSSDRVRVNGSLVDSGDNYKKTVSLSKGKNEIKIKVTNSSDEQRTYTLNVTRGNASDSQSDIYLDDLTISEGNLDFSEDDSSYTVDLDESVKSLKITAEPEDKEYLVTINDEQVKSSDDYEKKVSLDKGKNVFNVTVKDEVNDKKRTYTLTINRGKADDTQKTEDNKDTEDTKTKDTSENKSKWVQTNDGLKYYDENGQVLKNSWLYDKDNKVYNYLDQDGHKKTGWVEDKDKWYLLDEKGTMLTGWKKVNEKWYLLGADGAMFVGWYKDETKDAQSSNNTDGTTNTGDNTKKAETWYYLDTDGSMKTSWLSYNDKWYFFNTDGKMQKGWLIDSNSKYYLDENGVMATGTQTIDGKEYKFTDGGALIF